MADRSVSEFVDPMIDIEENDSDSHSESEASDAETSTSRTESIESEDEAVSGEVQPYRFEPVAPGAPPDGQNGQTEAAGPLDKIERLRRQRANRVNDLTWCQCGKCKVMADPIECVCCSEIDEFVRELQNYSPEPPFELDPDYSWSTEINPTDLHCYALHPAFQLNCLQVRTLKTAYYQYRSKYWKKDKDISPIKRYRYTAYRQLVRTVYGFLGDGIRVILPACCASKIKARFPNEGGVAYTNWLPPLN